MFILKGQVHVDEHVRILPAYTIIIQKPVVCVYKLDKTSTTASIAERAFPWKHKALRLVHEEPRSKRKCKVRERGCVATVRVIIDENPLQKSSK